MRHTKKQKSRHAGYFALVKLPTEKNPKVKKFQKVGHAEASASLAFSIARQKYGPNAEIRTQGIRLDVRPFYVGLVNGQQTVIYDEYRPGPKQQDYACGSSRVGKY